MIRGLGKELQYGESLQRESWIRLYILRFKVPFLFSGERSPPDDLVREVAALGQQAVALTDDGLYGAVRFYKAAVKEGIKPILGARLSIWDGSFITVLASDFHGYGNLCKLLSISFEGGTSPRHSITKQDLRVTGPGI